MLQVEVEDYIDTQDSKYGIITNRKRLSFEPFLLYILTQDKEYRSTIHLPYKKQSIKSHSGISKFDGYIVKCYFSDAEIKQLSKNVDSTTSIIKNTQKPIDLNCDKIIPKYRLDYFSCPLSFDANDSIHNDSILKYSNIDSLIEFSKSIEFVQYKQIPEKFSIFKNIEVVYLHVCRGDSYNLNMFPNLQQVSLFHMDFNFNSNKEWLNNINVFYAGKCSFKTLENFNIFSNIYEFEIANCGLVNPPTDISEMKHLRKFVLSNYKGVINLDSFDISRNSCLDTLFLQSWSHKMTGLPKNLDESWCREIYIYHPYLTEQEKQILNEVINTDKELNLKI